MSWINQLLISIFYHPRFKILRYGQFAVAIGLFAYMALSPSPPNPVPSFSDKALHFIGNVLLISSTWVALFGKAGKRRALVLAIAYSLLIEAAQHLSPVRKADVLDATANLIGISFGLGLCFAMDFYLNHIKSQTPNYTAAESEASN